MTEEYERVFVAVYVPKEVEVTFTPFTGVDELMQEFASKLEQLLDAAWVRPIDSDKRVRVGASLIFVDPVISVHGSEQTVRDDR